MNPETGHFEKIPEGEPAPPGHIPFTLGEKFILKGLAFNLELVQDDRIVLRYDKALTGQFIEKVRERQRDTKQRLASLTRRERRKLRAKRKRGRK